MRYHLTSVRMGIINKSTNNVLARMWRRKENPCALLVGMQIGADTWKAALSYLSKLKLELPYNPAIPILGVHTKKPENNLKVQYICTLMFIAVLLTIATIWEQPNCPSVYESIKKPWYIYTMEYYLAVKKKKHE